VCCPQHEKIITELTVANFGPGSDTFKEKIGILKVSAGQ
jgi:hypothetical protein